MQLRLQIAILATYSFIQAIEITMKAHSFIEDRRPISKMRLVEN